MQISIIDGQVRIQTSGLELIRLKTDLFRAIGNALSSAKGELFFPLACLDVVRQSIPIFSDFPQNQEELVFIKHAQARAQMYSGIQNLDSSRINEKWNSVLDPHQQYAVNAMITPGLLGVCLFDEQGCGKTVMTIAAMDMLKESREIDAVIIVCPKNMLSGWQSDIERFTQNKYVCQVLTGTPEHKRKQSLKEWDILISNYEGISSSLVSLSALAKNKRFLLVADESYYAKNAKTERAVVLSNLRIVCSKAFVLCGTPAPNSPYDLINQFDLADLGYTFSCFSKTNDINRDRKAIGEIINTRGTYIRRLKKEIYPNLPEKKFNIVRIVLRGRQRQLYDQARQSLVLQLRTYDNKTFKKNLASYFQKREVLLKLCSLPRSVDPAFVDCPAKYEVLDQLLLELFAQKRKVVLWTAYTASIDELVTRYAMYAPLVVDGRISGRQRGANVNEFQSNPERLLFIANPEAGGPGITLHASHDAVYVSYSNKAASHLQSIDRIHRRGQIANEVNYYYLICENTIEESEVMRLRARELQQHDLLGDTYSWPASLDEALAELTNELPHI